MVLASQPSRPESDGRLHSTENHRPRGSPLPPSRKKRKGGKKEGSENDCGSAGGPMLMNRWCGRGKVKPVRVGVSGTPCCVDRCADGRSSSPACSAKPVACVQNALIYPSLFFVIFGLAHGQPNCVSLRKITSSPLYRICSPPWVLRNNVAEFCVTLGSMWQWCKNVYKEPNMGFCSHCQGAKKATHSTIVLKTRAVTWRLLTSRMRTGSGR